MRCLLIGNYGAGNLGDELLKEYFLRRFSTIEWRVVSGAWAPGALPRLPTGVRSLLRTPWWRTIVAMRRSDAVVFGGGTLFTDSESLRACILWWIHACTARLLGTPVLFAFQGAGPFRTRAGEWLAKQAIGAAFVSVRDATSAARVKSWGMNTEIIQSFDPIFSLFLEEKTSERSNNVLIVFPRPDAGDFLEKELRSLLASRRFSRVLIGSLQPDHPGEREVCKHLCAQFPQAVVRPVRGAEELRTLLREGATVLSQRFHGSLAALALRKELITVAQTEGDKHASIPMGADPQALLDLVEKGEAALREALGRLSVVR